MENVEWTLSKKWTPAGVPRSRSEGAEGGRQRAHLSQKPGPFSRFRQHFERSPTKEVCTGFLNLLDHAGKDTHLI